MLVVQTKINLKNFIHYFGVGGGPAQGRKYKTNIIKKLSLKEQKHATFKNIRKELLDNIVLSRIT